MGAQSLLPRRMPCAVAFLLAGVQSLLAGEVWSWHSVDATILKTSAAEVLLHGRLRTGRSLGTPQQGRAGVVARFPAPRHLTWIAGHYYGKEEDSAEEWRNFHRLFTGVELPAYRSPAVTVDT